MRKFLSTLWFLALLAALGFLGWRNYALTHEVHALRQTRLLLEQEKRTLETRVATGDGPGKPEEQADTRHLIEQQTSQIRGLPFKGPVTYKMIGRDELRDVLIKKMGEQYSKQEFRDYGRTLETLGLIPKGTDLMEAIIGLYDEQVAAFYVPEERALYTFKDMSFNSNLDKVTLSHELTHALQDQNFDLTTFPLKVKDNDDLALATSALVEGDATVEMAQFYGEHLDVKNILGDMMGGMLGQKTAKFQASPPFFREMLLFPYQQGAEFTMAVMAAGGTEALNDAFRHPPVSTHEILHPEKFLRNRQAPENIGLPALNLADCRRIGNNVLGEFGIRSLLAQSLGVFEAQRVAGGWKGDRYQVYERGTNGPTALVWKTAWDTTDDAEDFEQAYRRVAEKRDVKATVVRDGTHVTVWQSRDDTLLGQLKESGS